MASDIFQTRTTEVTTLTKPRHKGGRSLAYQQTRESTQQLHKFTSIYYDNYTKITLYFKLGHYQ